MWRYCFKFLARSEIIHKVFFFFFKGCVINSINHLFTGTHKRFWIYCEQRLEYLWNAFQIRSFFVCVSDKFKLQSGVSIFCKWYTERHKISKYILLCNKNYLIWNKTTAMIIFQGREGGGLITNLILFINFILASFNDETGPMPSPPLLVSELIWKTKFLAVGLCVCFKLNL